MSNLKKYFITTYGCQMNVHESEKLAGILSSLGYEKADNETSADVIVFNTCCIRENAVKRAEGNIGALKKFKKCVFYLFILEKICYFIEYTDKLWYNFIQVISQGVLV